MEGFVLELNKRATPVAAQPDPSAPALDVLKLPPAPAAEANENAAHDGIGTFRGLAFGLPIAAALWIAIIGIVTYVID